jgi:hypothetical protein
MPDTEFRTGSTLLHLFTGSRFSPACAKPVHPPQCYGGRATAKAGRDDGDNGSHFPSPVSGEGTQQYNKISTTGTGDISLHEWNDNGGGTGMWKKTFSSTPAIPPYPDRVRHKSGENEMKQYRGSIPKHTSATGENCPFSRFNLHD